MFILEDKKNGDLYYGLSKEEVEQKVKELGLKDDEWFAHLGI